MLRLYEGIALGKFHSDTEAEKVIYPGSLGGAAYRKLKSDLKERLLEAVNQIDTNQSQFSDFQKAYYYCHRQWAIVRILTGLNANNAALNLAAKLLKISEKFHLTLLTMDIASYLRVQYGLREGNDSKYKEAKAAFTQSKAVYDAESLAEEMYVELVSGYVNVRTVKEELLEVVNDNFEKIAPSMALYKSYKLQMYGYLVGLLRYTCINDFENASQYCEEAIRFFKSLPYEAPTPLQIFYYQSLVCNIQTRRFKEGKIAADECLRLMSEGTFNWFKYQELFLKLSLHSGEYEQSVQTLQSILHHPRFEFLPDNVKEVWAICEAYIYCLSLLGKVKMVGSDKFNLGYFERKTTIFSKDKGGLNVAILIVRFLIQLQEGNVRKIMDEQDALNQYCYRHLKGENTRRSYWFIKMLLLIPYSHFDLKLVESRAGALREKLDAVPFEVANQTNEIEIIPYEHLWEMAIQILKSK